MFSKLSLVCLVALIQGASSLGTSRLMNRLAQAQQSAAPDLASELASFVANPVGGNKYNIGNGVQATYTDLSAPNYSIDNTGLIY